MNLRQIFLIAIFTMAGLMIFAGCSNTTAKNNPPSVNITSPVENASIGGEAHFNAEASDPDGQIKEILWSFGDGQTSKDLKTTHQYAKGGEYVVELAVTDNQGATAKDSIKVNVQVGPSAVATVSRVGSESSVGSQFISDEAPLPVAFSSQYSKPGAGSQLTRYHWDFGNGDVSEEPNPIYTFKALGEYTVTLTVTDNKGGTSLSEVLVRVIAYEPTDEQITLASGEAARYEIYSKNIRDLNTGPSMFYQYVVNINRKLTEEEIKFVLEDIIEKARQRPRVGRISVQLFDEIKREFMAPREYAHFLGVAVWDREEGKSFAINERYLDGKAISVLSHTIQEQVLFAGDPECGEICNNFRIGLIDIFVQEPEVCNEILVRSIREIAIWRLSASFDGYLVTIHPQNLSGPIAWAIGARQSGPPLDQLPVHLFSNPPKKWSDQKDKTLWLHLQKLPACK